MVNEVENNNEVENIEEGSDSDTLSLKGEVIEILPNTKFKVKLQNGSIILAHASGKMRKNRIKVLQHDSVNVEVSISDLENLKRKDVKVNGRITFRYKA
jgi:translation initiation factor IF-1